MRIVLCGGSSAVLAWVNLGTAVCGSAKAQTYFFDRRKEMDYQVGPDRAERGDTLLEMLAGNSLAVGKRRSEVYLRQAFMTAANAFQAVDANPLDFHTDPPSE